MFPSLLARGTERLFDIWLGSANSSSFPVGDASIGINTPNARLPSPAVPLRHVASVCGQTISPIYNKIQSILNGHLDHAVGCSSGLEPFDQEEVIRNTTSGVTSSDLWPQYPTDIDPRYRRHDSISSPPRQKRRRLVYPLEQPIIIPTPHSVPTILITPCPTLSQYTSRVPLQDASYGNKLTVPGYAQFNSFFPPLKPTSRAVFHTQFITRWRWEKGHWWAAVPNLETQIQKGWFSRPLNARRVVQPCK